MPQTLDMLLLLEIWRLRNENWLACL